MTKEEIRGTVLRSLTAIAPEVDPEAIEPDVELREQLDLDSVDFLNLVVALHKELRVDIPERDYPRLATLNGCVEYLASAVARQRV